MNDNIQHNNWWERNWKWFIPLVSILVLVCGLLFSSKLGGNVAGMIKIHSERSVCDNALEVAKKNRRVIELLGELQPLSKLAIVEGSHKYSNNYDRLEVSVNVVGSKKGSKIRCKMDIVADRNGDDWIYKTINIRIKKPTDLKQIIEIIKLPK